MDIKQFLREQYDEILSLATIGNFSTSESYKAILGAKIYEMKEIEAGSIFAELENSTQTSNAQTRYTTIQDALADMYDSEFDADEYVVVAGAGTPEANGTYTERGTNAGKPYYNLVGEPDNTAQSSIIWDDGWFMLSADGVQTYYSSLDATDFPWEAEFLDDDGELPPPTLTKGDNFADDRTEVIDAIEAHKTAMLDTVFPLLEAKVGAIRLQQSGGIQRVGQ